MTEQPEAIDLASADAEIPEAESARPHGYKLDMLLENDKLTAGERARVHELCLPRYRDWTAAMEALTSHGDERLAELTDLLNDYKRFIELDFIFDSPDDFLYRQAGQIKLGASIMEEFLPRLTHPSILPELADIPFTTGPRSAFAGAYFMTSLTTPSIGAGFSIGKKDQDFTISQPIWLKASTDPAYSPEHTIEYKTHLAFFAVECKTNLDRTMFEAAATASRDLKATVSGARYYVVCEWLDMTPVNTDATAVDEVIILRGKRVGSNKRKRFAKASERAVAREWYAAMLAANPIRLESLERLVTHMRRHFAVKSLDERKVLDRGYF
jgi:hypothetical protein